MRAISEVTIRTSAARRRDRRLGRPQPVDRDRRRGGDPRRLRARRSAPTSLEGRSVAVVGVGHVGGPLAEALAAGGARLVLADIDERPPRARRPARRRVDRPAHRADRRGRRARALRARRRARRGDRPGAALPRRSRAPPTTSSRPTTSASCSPPATSSGCPTSWPTPAASSTSRSSSRRAATTPPAPRPTCARSATRCAPCSTTRTRTGPRRWPRRWRSPGGAWKRPAPPRRLTNNVNGGWVRRRRVHFVAFVRRLSCPFSATKRTLCAAAPAPLPSRSYARPSSRSFSSARGVTSPRTGAASAGASDHAASSSSSSVRSPRSSASTNRRSRSSRCST